MYKIWSLSRIASSFCVLFFTCTQIDPHVVLYFHGEFAEKFTSYFLIEKKQLRNFVLEYKVRVIMDFLDSTAGFGTRGDLES